MCVVPQRPKEGANSPVGGVIGSCELSKVDTGNPMWVLCEISKCLNCRDIAAASIIRFYVNHFVSSISSCSIQLGKCGAGDIEFIVKKKKKTASTGILGTATLTTPRTKEGSPCGV